MSVTSVNERLAALTAAGTSVWLDQIRRGMIEDGELERMVAEDSLRGVTSNPAIFEKAILGSSDYDDDIGRRRARGPVGARGLPPPGGQGRPARGRRAAPGLRRDRRLRRLRVARGRAAAGARHRGHARAGAHVLGPRRPPEPDDQDPGDRRGHPGDRGGPLRGHERQRHAAVRGLLLRAGDGGLHPRHGAPPRGRAARSTATRSPRSSSRASTPRSTSGSRPPAAPTSPAAPGSPTPAPPTSTFREVFDGERFAALREAGCPVQRPLWASTGVKNPAYPETMYVYGLVGRDSVNTMPLPTLTAAARDGEVTGETSAEDPTADLRRPARGRHRPRRRHREAAARRHRRLRGADEQAARRHREQARGDRHRPPGDDRRRPAGRARAGRRRPPAARAGRRRRAPHLAPRRHAVGAGGHARGHQPARLARHPREDARLRRRPRGLRARGARGRLHRRRAVRHGRLQPGARGVPPLVAEPQDDAARARLDAPGRRQGDDRRDRPREDAVRHLLQVGRDDRDAVPVQVLPRAARATARTSSPSRIRAAASPSSAASTASGACSRTTPTSAAATRRCRTSGSCRRC